MTLVQLAGIEILNFKQTAIKALEKISTSWPKAVADAGGIFELAKVIIQDEPQPPHALWESAALVLSNVFENTISIALNALIVHDRSDASSAEQMMEAGVTDALLDLLLRSHV